MDLLLASFFESYGLLIILVVAFAGIMVYYYLRSRKFQQVENQFQTGLKKGDKVKTYSGFYGTVEKITETTDGKVVTLKLGGNASVDFDIRALMSIDQKTEVVDIPEAEKVEEPAKEEPKEEPKEEKPAEEQAPKKRARKKAE